MPATRPKVRADRPHRTASDRSDDDAESAVSHSVLFAEIVEPPTSTTHRELRQLRIVPQVFLSTQQRAVASSLREHLFADCAGDSPTSPLLLLARSGAGKSTLLADLARQLRTETPAVLVFSVFVGATDASTSAARFLWELVETIAREGRVLGGGGLSDCISWLPLPRVAADRERLSVPGFPFPRAYSADAHWPWCSCVRRVLPVECVHGSWVGCWLARVARPVCAALCVKPWNLI